MKLCFQKINKEICMYNRKYLDDKLCKSKPLVSFNDIITIFIDCGLNCYDYKNKLNDNREPKKCSLTLIKNNYYIHNNTNNTKGFIVFGCLLCNIEKILLFDKGFVKTITNYRNIKI
jgi:hypothetical protein